nr:TRAP transporter small permease [uncultured Cohaesibacter sp.]
MHTHSIWLGRMHQLTRKSAIVAILVALVAFLLLIIQQFTAEDPIGMYEMLRPQGRPLVLLMLWSLFAAVMLFSIYLSDRIGKIEIAPRGFFDILSLVASRLGMIGIVGIVLVMFYEVVVRYAFNAPTLWANELSWWIAAFVFLLAGLYAMQQRCHIRIYILYAIMPRWLQKTADILNVVLIWGFSVCLIWGGYNEAQKKLMSMETLGTAWDPPIPATVKPAVLIIFVLVAIQSLSNLIADWNNSSEPLSPMDEIDEEEIKNIRATLKED